MTRTRGFTGADIKNVVNLAALHAVSRNQIKVRQVNFDAAIDKVRRKAARLKSRATANYLTWDRLATHKVGAAVVNAFLDADSVQKLELLDLDSHFQLGEAGSFAGIKFALDKSQKTWKSQMRAPFHTRCAPVLSGLTAATRYSARR